MIGELLGVEGDMGLAEGSMKEELPMAINLLWAREQKHQPASLLDITAMRADTLSTGAGVPVGDKLNSLTAGPRGPLLVQDVVFTDEMAHFDRERIPERVVHAKGAGAFGYFEVTHDITKYTKAKIFEHVGKRTPTAVRFSTVAGEAGSADTVRDPRGFAMKFYTEEGNWDLTGNNTPIFFIRDPLLFPSFVHSQKRNPQTHLKDPDMVWDFWSLRPESLHQVTFLFSDRGIPDGHRHMNGYGSHTFKLVNNAGQAVYCKFHFKEFQSDRHLGCGAPAGRGKTVRDCFSSYSRPYALQRLTDQGIKNIPVDEASRLSSTNPDYGIQDLYNAIANGNYPSWSVFIQVMTFEQAEQFRWNPFDLTKVWSHKDFPLIPVGKLMLNRNPVNYFAEVEQLAFDPSNMPPGIEPSPDKMLQGWLSSSVYNYTVLSEMDIFLVNYIVPQGERVRAGEAGSADTVRDPRGFAMKFYTEEGNWDLTGNNTPIFFIRDPLLFPSFVHSQKRNPQTHLKDPDMVWDFWSLRPESLHQVTFLFSDRGIPGGHRHMNGYGSHTFKLVNNAGQAVYCKFHFKEFQSDRHLGCGAPAGRGKTVRDCFSSYSRPYALQRLTDQGIKNIPVDEASRLSSTNPDYGIQDLYNAIANGNYPSWSVFIQVMTFEQAEQFRWNPFDLTKVWSHKDFPLIPVGKLMLNRNPVNYFAEVEQLAFDPSNMPPGIEPSPDKMLQGRLFSYPDTHRHRLGANYLQIPVNCPYKTRVANYQRDGPMCMFDNQGGAPNYYPNSFSAPDTQPQFLETKFRVSADVARFNSSDDDNVTQVRTFYTQVLNEEERQRLCENIAGHLKEAQLFIQKRAVSEHDCIQTLNRMWSQPGD
ncbi:UNVERIFIED_CONTAM: hypothetical protein FKN15_025891 [Acipenser sinensis]